MVALIEFHEGVDVDVHAHPDLSRACLAHGGGKDPAVYQIRALSFDGKTDIAVYHNVRTSSEPFPWRCTHVRCTTERFVFLCAGDLRVS